MSDQRLLIDTDAFIIFAGNDLLDDVLKILGYRKDQAIRLDALPHMLRKSARLKANYPGDVIAKALKACDSVPSLKEREADPKILDRLLMAGSGDINGGEALMLAVAIEDQKFSLLTGDRKAISTFGQSDDVSDLRAVMNGRVVCLEMILRVLVNHLGVAEIASHLAPLIPKHKSLSIFFSPANQADHAQCHEALNIYFENLVVIVGVDLLLDLFSHERVRSAEGPEKA